MTPTTAWHLWSAHQQKPIPPVGCNIAAAVAATGQPPFPSRQATPATMTITTPRQQQQQEEEQQQHIKHVQYIPFYHAKAIDTLTQGGVRRGIITELAGEAGSGKTQLLLQLVVNAVLPPVLLRRLCCSADDNGKENTTLTLVASAAATAATERTTTNQQTSRHHAPPPHRHTTHTTNGAAGVDAAQAKHLQNVMFVEGCCCCCRQCAADMIGNQHAVFITAKPFQVARLQLMVQMTLQHWTKRIDAPTKREDVIPQLQHYQKKLKLPTVDSVMKRILVQHAPTWARLRHCVQFALPNLVRTTSVALVAIDSPAALCRDMPASTRSKQLFDMAANLLSASARGQGGGGTTTGSVRRCAATNYDAASSQALTSSSACCSGIHFPEAFAIVLVNQVSDVFDDGGSTFGSNSFCDSRDRTMPGALHISESVLNERMQTWSHLSSGRRITPALGLAWASCCASMRIVLTRKQTTVGGMSSMSCSNSNVRRRAILVHAPHVAGLRSCVFVITARGIEDDPDIGEEVDLSSDFTE